MDIPINPGNGKRKKKELVYKNLLLRNNKL